MPYLDASALEIDRPGLRLLAEVLSDRPQGRGSKFARTAAEASHTDLRTCASGPVAGWRCVGRTTSTLSSIPGPSLPSTDNPLATGRT